MYLFVNICSHENCRLRKKINNLVDTDSVQKLKMKVCCNTDFTADAIDILYGGKVLCRSASLADCELEPGATVYLLPKPPAYIPAEPNLPSRGEIQTLIRDLQIALTNPRHPVQQYFSSPGVLKNLVELMPALCEDPVALGILHSPDLLSRLAEPKTMLKVLEKHPSLVLVVKTALKAKRTTTPSRAVGTGQGHYSLDQMSDDDDDDDVMQPSLGVASNQRGPAQPITANLLATALAAATGEQHMSGSMQESARGSGSGSTTAGSAPPAAGATGGAISGDFVRQALQQALGGAPLPHGSQQQQQQAYDDESKLMQLREMGITDETVARQALIAAQGDIQAALEIIFGEPL